MLFGPKDAFLLVDGYDLTATRMERLRMKVTSVLEDANGVGTQWEESYPTGQQRGEIEQTRAFFRPGAGEAHELLKDLSADPNGAARIVCAAYAGNVIGRPFDGFEGAYQMEYEVMTASGALQKANPKYQVTGQVDRGALILQPLATETATFDTESNSVDNGASSAAGGVGYLQVMDIQGYTSFEGVIQHSADGIAWAALVTFASAAALGPQRIEVAGTVNRYLSFDGTFTGAGPGSVRVFAGFKRG